MPPRPRHPEALALTLIVVLLVFPTIPGRILPLADEEIPEAADRLVRLVEKIVEAELRIVETIVRLAGRLGAGPAIGWIPLEGLR